MASLSTATTSPAQVVDARVAGPESKPWHIRGLVFDLVWIVGMPMLAFLVIVATCLPRVPGQSILGMVGTTPPLLAFVAGTVTFTHINVTVARIYLNKDVFSRFGTRLVVAPIILFVALAVSSPMLAIIGVVAMFWDEYHSFMQTFGFGRIYDARLGNDPNVGRWHDIFMCFVLEWLPYLIAATFVGEEDHEIFRTGPEYALTRRGRFIAPGELQGVLIGFAILYAIFYVASYTRFARRGYRVAPAKIALFVSTGAANWLLVGFFSLIEGAAMANLYHGLQYIAIIWVSERFNLRGTFRLSNLRKAGVAIAFLIILVPSVMVAVARVAIPASHLLMAFWATSSLLHFWSDGFVWSVRKQQAL
ncbi:MAG: hypothetical protein HY791_34320 [Deltaproteobacteria bacterium]|nr:hypothetical protein [Deltaproteobacteria bacterium]